VHKYSALFDYYKRHDPTIFMSMQALKAMKGNTVLPYAEEILRFLDHRDSEAPLRLYAERSRELIGLQRQFEETGNYPATCYADVRPIDRERYNASLLLSFITTHHRFEILQQLVQFLGSFTEAPRRLLAVGVGAGYEIKLAYDYLKEWEVAAFDTSSESVRYAADLLSFGGAGVRAGSPACGSASPGQNVSDTGHKHRPGGSPVPLFNDFAGAESGGTPRVEDRV
jgi:hypothetical protein